MSKLKCGAEKKFTVIKNDDIRQYLSEEEQKELRILLFVINRAREEIGKGINEYLVVNTDEPYAQEVINVLKRNGHWG
jgi:hypothetical protein